MRRRTAVRDVSLDSACISGIVLLTSDSEARRPPRQEEQMPME